MTRSIGTIARGIRCPIIREGDDLAKIAVESVLTAATSEGFSLRDRDVVGITESIVARSQGNYAHISAIEKDVREKLGGEIVGVIFPILSRNRFSICLRGIARGAKKIVLMLSYPSDEVGNALLTYDLLDKAGINPYSDVLTLEKYRALFGYKKHEMTGVDYVESYQQIIEAEGTQVEIIFANSPKAILPYTKDVLVCDIHSRERTKRILREQGARRVWGLDDILSASIDGNGYNEKYGLLGSNMATEDSIKLFPNDCFEFVADVQERFLKETGKIVEVLVYGDGAFKDPRGHIWELADPVVSPGYTKGLFGTTKEIKLKYLADDEFKELAGEALREAITKRIREKNENDINDMAAQGTTPRQLTDLIGSLCDLTSGSGDKGTPIVLIQGYFDSYSG